MEQLSSSERTIVAFYKALECGDVATIGAMVTEDLEWRFHGPPTHQHLMRMLTGADRLGSFSFKPSRICMIGDRVFAEGRSVVVNQPLLSPSPSRSSSASSSSSRSSSSSSSSSAKSRSATANSGDEICWVHIWSIDPLNSRIVELNECFNTSVTVTAPASCNTLWQSQATTRSMPGLVFAM